MRLHGQLLGALVLSGSGPFFSGCQHVRPDPNAAAYAAVSAGLGDDFRATIHEKVALYQTGPQQLTLPDAQLKKGTLVRLIRKELGYSLVQIAPGNQLGWVANENLGVAPVGGAVDDAELAGPSPSASVAGAAVASNSRDDLNPAIVGRYKIVDPNNLGNGRR
jgi:hypothetical protein